MCEPIALAGATLALGVASTGIQYVQGTQQASQQRAYQNKVAEAQAETARQANTNIRIQQAQQRENLARVSAKIQKQAMEHRAAAKVAAGESGVAGNSVDALLADFSRQEGNYYEANLRQSQMLDTSANMQIDQNIANNAAAVAQIYQPVSQPSPFASALTIGKNVLDAGETFYSLNKRLPTPSKPYATTTK